MISNNIFTSDIISGHYFHADGNVDVDGNLKVDGDFTVNGTTSTVNSITLTVDDKNIELGSVDIPTNGTADGGGLTLKGGTDKTIIWLQSNDSWNFNQNIVVDGRIGIGTNPSVGLEINHTDALKIPKGTTLERPSSTTEAERGFIRYNTTTDQFEGFGAGNAWGSLGGVIDVDQDTYISAENSAGSDNDELKFFTSGSARAIIDSTGRVGIGTTSPLARVQIETSDGSTIYDPSDTKPPMIGDCLLSLRNRYDGGNVAGTFAGIQFNIDGDGTGSINSIGAINLVVEEDNLQKASLCFSPDPGGVIRKEAMRISSDGYIGVGATDPSCNLHIKGLDPADGGETKLCLESQDGTQNAAIAHVDEDGKERLSIRVGGHSAGVDRMTILNNGNVGIGTINPISKLTVQSDASSSVPLRIPRSTDPGNGSNYLLALTEGSDNHSMLDMQAANGISAVRLTTSGDSFLMGGNVGIGTTTPDSGSKLHVVGKTTIESSGPVLVLKDTDGGDVNSQNGFIDYRDQNDVQRAYVGFGSSGNKDFSMWSTIGDLRFGTGTGSGTAGQVKMWIKANGTVEIPGNLVVTGTTTTNNVETVSTSNGVIFEGSAADDYEGILKAGTLTDDRTYTLPDATGLIALTNNISNSTVTITAGGALTGGGNFSLNGSGGTITLNHQDTSSQGSSNNSGRTYIQDITLDGYGHVTGIGTATETVVDTNTTYSAGTALGLSGTTFNVSPNLIFATTPTIGTSQTKLELDAVNGFRFHGWNSQSSGTEETMRLNTQDELHVKGDVVAFSTVFSDKKLKDNIGQIKGGLEKVKKLRGVEFDWNATSRKGTKDIGVIAQEVEEVVPEVVSEKVPCVGEFCGNTEKYKTVDYSKLVPVLIEAIKDLSEEVEELKKKLS